MFEIRSILLIAGLTLGYVIVINGLLWGILSLLAKTKAKPRISPNINNETLEYNPELHKRVAAIAVAVALELEKEKAAHEFPLPPTALVSAWQAVMRSQILRRNGRPR